MNLPFRIDLVEYLADHRSAFLTPVFQLFTAIGDLEGYILLIVLIYVAYDKRLAVRLSVIALLAMSLNHALKTLIHNPRPFISDGSYLRRWAVSAQRAAALATEYSTPSGHAMASGSFYGYLAATARSRYARIACITCMVLIGISRPYLGVHYAEDVLSGWVLGLALALFAIRYQVRITEQWSVLTYRQQVAVLLATSFALWIATRMYDGGASNGLPSAFVSYAGLLTGILAAQPLEARLVDFDPKSNGWEHKVLRYILSVGLVLATLIVLKMGATALTIESSPSADLLRFIRYAAAGVVGLLVAPLLFVRLGLADRRSATAPTSFDQRLGAVRAVEITRLDG